MRAMLHPYGSPEWRLTDAALSQLSQLYRLPVFGTAGATDSKVVDEQAAIEASYSLLFAALTGTNLIHDVGYLESGLCGALDYLVMCNDMIGLTRRILRGIRVDREAIAVDLIDKVGPGKHFTGEEHTLKNYKEEMWYPGLLDRKDFNAWKADGEVTFQQRCIAEAKRILKEHEVEPVSDETSQEIKNILSKMERKYDSAS
jgi:trimethylamine--corrinoid protein Co-methyltransferase